jgi:hypothetical protein
VKLIAFILLFSFSAYLSEAVIFPHQYIAVSQTKVNSCRDKCKLMQQNEKCQKESAKKGCDQSCNNCPVFASFYPDHANNTTAISPVFKFPYPNFISRFISNYTTETWKPPNML